VLPLGGHLPHCCTFFKVPSFVHGAVTPTQCKGCSSAHCALPFPPIRTTVGVSCAPTGCCVKSAQLTLNLFHLVVQLLEEEVARLRGQGAGQQTSGLTTSINTAAAPSATAASSGVAALPRTPAAAAAAAAAAHSGMAQHGLWAGSHAVGIISSRGSWAVRGTTEQ